MASLSNISRIIFIWGFCFTVNIFFPEYNLESRNLWVNLAKLVAFMMLAMGIIRYLKKPEDMENNYFSLDNNDKPN